MWGASDEPRSVAEDGVLGPWLRRRLLLAKRGPAMGCAFGAGTGAGITQGQPERGVERARWSLQMVTLHAQSRGDTDGTQVADKFNETRDLRAIENGWIRI